MNDLNREMIERYGNGFLREVEDNVEQGKWAKLCTQCGACAGSCPLGDAWEHNPQTLIMMIRAGKRDEVLGTDSMWMCTSCYSCVVRCPQGIPVTHLMHGLAHYAERLDKAPAAQPTRQFALKFWENIEKHGRINEPELALQLYFMNGLAEGIRTTIGMREMGFAMRRSGRFKTLALGALVRVNVGHKGVKDKAGLRKILAKAKALEAARLTKGRQ